LVGFIEAPVLSCTACADNSVGARYIVEILEKAMGEVVWISIGDELVDYETRLVTRERTRDFRHNQPYKRTLSSIPGKRHR
jgi:hypothetical protein